MKQFIQVGEMAERDPATGAFLESRPLYMIADEALVEGRARMEGKLSTILADKFISYTKGAAEEGVVI